VLFIVPNSARTRLPPLLPLLDQELKSQRLNATMKTTNASARVAQRRSKESSVPHRASDVSGCTMHEETMPSNWTSRTSRER